MSAAIDAHLPKAAERTQALRARRSRLAARFQSDEGGLGEGALLVPSGLLLAVEGSDQHHPYRAHDEHAYLAGVREVGQVLSFDARAGWQLFARQATAEDRVWHGPGESLEGQAERSGIDAVHPLSELSNYVETLGARPVALLGSMDLLERPKHYAVHPEQLPGLELDADLSAWLDAIVIDERRRKDRVEQQLIRAAGVASEAGHLEVLRAARAGWSERRLGLEVDCSFLRAGAERPAYGTIAVAGERCAVLHAAPSERLLCDGDLVLIDAGAEVDGYDSDVTRTWPVGRRFSAQQRALYELVLAVHGEAIAGLRPGVEYRELHLKACASLAQGLVDLGFLRGKVDGLVERDAHALFFPHGLGHLLGLSTHDVGGYPAGRTRSTRMGLKYLRIDLPMEEGFVVTIEPGLYFVRALLEDAELHEQYKDSVNWEQARQWLPVGGVRIEDDVLVTADGAEVLTAAIPREIDELEALRAQAP